MDIVLKGQCRGRTSKYEHKARRRPGFWGIRTVWAELWCPSGKDDSLSLDPAALHGTFVESGSKRSSALELADLSCLLYGAWAIPRV